MLPAAEPKERPWGRTIFTDSTFAYEYAAEPKRVTVASEVFLYQDLAREFGMIAIHLHRAALDRHHVTHAFGREAHARVLSFASAADQHRDRVEGPLSGARV